MVIERIFMTIFRSVLIGMFCAVFALPDRVWAVDFFEAVTGVGQCPGNYKTATDMLKKQPSLANFTHKFGGQEESVLEGVIRGCCIADDSEYKDCRRGNKKKNRDQMAQLLIDNHADIDRVIERKIYIGRNSRGEETVHGTLLDYVRALKESQNCWKYGSAFCDKIEAAMVKAGAKTYEDLQKAQSATTSAATPTTPTTPATPAPAPSAESETVSQPVGPVQTESESEPEVTPVVPAAESKTTNSGAAKLTDISVSGIVVDGKTDKPIPFLSMILVDSKGEQISYSDGVSSDANGKFERTFRNVPEDAKILISKLEYKKQTLTPGMNMKIVMLPSRELDAIKVAADRVSCEPEELKSLYAVAGKINRDGDGTAVCVPTVCINDYDLRDGECVMRMQKLDINQEDLKARQDEMRKALEGQIAEIELENDCVDTDRHIKKGTFRDTDKEMLCAPLECEAGYVISRNGNECTECKRGSHIKSMTSQDNKCVIESCDKDYLIKEDKCVKNCGKGWYPDETNTRCVEGTEEPAPSEEPAPVDPEKIAELQKAYDDAKATETSTANRMLGGLTMAATGIGGMQLAQGLAEQNADKKAEQDMAAYLTTFQCKIGDKGGKSYSGGEMGIEVGGTNQLVNLYQQYVDLAASLKERKTALGMAPGIESQVVMDKANMGLYDDTGRGIENGTYASLYRASRGNETDANKLADQQNTSATRVKGGAIAAGVGAIGGAIGNSAINGKIADLIKDAKTKNANNKDNKAAIEEFKKGLTSAGFKNVNKLDFSSLDISGLKGKLSGVDWSGLTNKFAGQDVTQVLNTTNASSFSSSLTRLLGQ